MDNEQKDQQLHISVRNLVEFIFREGDIDNRVGKLAANAMQEGSRIHRKLQKSMGEGYQAEVPLSVSIHAEDYTLTVEGRADGILFMEEKPEEPLLGNAWYIDEIKGVYRSLATLQAPVYVHQAQAMCYAYIYALQKNLDRIGVQLTYCNLDTEEIRRFWQEYRWEELSLWFLNLIDRYRKWADFQVYWRQKRQESIQKLTFPFPYREGQRELAADVYRSIKRKKTLFLQAPTGVGKTISTIFPAVKAVGEELAERIFYLTAKTITATVAKDTFSLLQKQGYVAKIIQLTAKEKLCPNEVMECNPVGCPYAKGHFDRVNDAVYALLQKADMITREEILAQAEESRVCPFELGLDVASWADNILCDYNYLFDPNVYLKRFFSEGVKGDYIFLVDEAHNLVERSREMYSAELVKEDVLAVKRIMKKQSPSIGRMLEQCNRELLARKRECGTYQVYGSLGAFVLQLMRLAGKLEEFLENPVEFAERSTVLDFYFTVRNFLGIYELVDDHYVIYGQMREGEFVLKLFCVDPSANLQERVNKARSTVFFSATLLPVNYYKKLLSTRSDDYAIYAKSTFLESQRLLMFGKDVSTKYTRRNPGEYKRIAEYILAAVRGRRGNYMVFFPSYSLMREVCTCFGESAQEGEKFVVLCQRANMKEEEREEFLAAFEEEREETLVAFCVLGGIFGEGIDLKKDRLIGAVIVGTGLPQISYEREILKNYYEQRGQSGFDYAFRYPGMNKVLQAAGRVIRTAEDRGILLLLDERFLQADYAPLFPREWSRRIVCDVGQVGQEVSSFWHGEVENG
ncbi:MAG: ATP-dependent DNA helicase [Roseburia sp.]|nr:ATP-dependent DNA helicase [Roseburia sp.]MCM1430205.1 ATP-dependent DNA helicase [Muribaculaceae bacterium]